MQNYFKLLVKYAFVWIGAIVFWTLMRDFGQEVVDAPVFESNFRWIMAHVSVGIVAGIMMATVETLVRHRVKAKNFGVVILINSAVNLVAFLMFIVVGIYLFNYIQKVATSHQLVSDFLFSNEGLLLVFYCYLVSFLVHFVNQIDRKFGPGNLVKFLFGVFQEPKEVERIFMFLDLNDSTSIAEKLGHLRYSQMIQDCFYDLKVVEKYKAEVYQYVGDEVVLTWDITSGVEASNCIAAFFAFKNVLQSRTEHYQSSYGVIPSFKGGLNYGIITVVEVGEIKREIAYHGDTINVASRIQGLCKELGRDLLLSDTLYSLLTKREDFDYTFERDIVLKGKEKSSRVFSVSS